MTRLILLIPAAFVGITAAEIFTTAAAAIAAAL